MRKMMMIALAGASALAAMPAHAATTYTDFSAWSAAAGSYTETSSYGNEYDSVSSVTLGDGTTLGFGTPVTVLQVGSSWGTWSGGYAGQVLYSNGSPSLDVAVSPVSALGFYVEPDNFDTYNFTLTLSDGSTASASYDGNGGAGFLGFVGKGITGLNVTTNDADFALGDIYSVAGGSAVPEPASWAMMIGGIGMAGGMMRRRRAAVRTTINFA